MKLSRDLIEIYSDSAAVLIRAMCDVTQRDFLCRPRLSQSDLPTFCRFLIVLPFSAVGSDFQLAARNEFIVN